MKIYDIEKDKIILYPYRTDFYSVGIIFSICLYIIMIPIILDLKEHNTEIPLIYIILSLIVPLIILFPFFGLSKRNQVIIDTDQNRLFVRNLFSLKYATSLNNIQEIRLNSEAVFLNMKIYYYVVVDKDDKFGEGIRITPKFRLKSQMLKKFEETVFDRICDILANNKASIEKETTNRTLTSFIEERANYYIFRKTYLSCIIACVFCLFIFIYCITKWSYKDIYTYIPLLLSFIMFFSIKFKICIDLNNNILELHTLQNLYKKQILLSNIEDIFLHKVSHKGSISTTINILYYNPDKKETKTHSLFSSNKKHEFTNFANDLEILLNRKITTTSRM